MEKEKTVLIVDQEKLLIDLLRSTFLEDDFAVFTSTSAEEAMHLADVHEPDFIVVDPAIPQGLMLLHQLLGGTRQSTTVVLTHSQELRTQARAMGLNTVIDKSEGLDALMTAIPGLVVRDEAGQKRIKVLVVDDNEDTRVILSKFLRGSGYGVSTAGTGTQALKAVEEDPSLQAVLLDINIPDKGGLETLKEIMSREQHPSVIMISAITDAEIARRAVELGAFDYLVKPLDLARVKTAIHASLTHSEYQRMSWWKRVIGA